MNQPQNPQDARSRLWLVVLTVATLMLAAAVAQSFGRFTWGVVLPDARDDVLDGSNTLAGLFGTVNVTAYLIGTLVAAQIAPRVSLTQMLRRGLLLSTSGLVTMWLVPVPLVMAIALFVMGLGGALIWIPSPALAARALPPRHRGLGAGLVGSGIGAGIVFAGQIAAWRRTSDRVDTWQDVYGIETAIAVFAVIAVFTILRSRGEHPSAPGGLGGFGALRRVAGWKPLALCYTAYGFAYLLVIAFVVARLEDDSGLSSSTAAAVFSVLGLAVIVGGLSVGAAADRFGVRVTLVVASSVFGLSTLLMLTGRSPWIWIAAVGLGMMFSGIPSSIVAHIVHHASDEDYGPAFSAATLAFGVAQLLAPQVGGLVADATGSFTLVFVMSAICSGLGAIAGSRLPRFQSEIAE